MKTKIKINKSNPETKERETTEQMDASAAGSYEAPMSMPVIKKSMPRQEEVTEVTDSSASGAYDVSFSSGRKDPLKIEGPKSIQSRRSTMKKNKTPMWGGPGSKFVGVKEKCKKYPYCNEDPNAIEIYNESEKLSSKDIFIDDMKSKTVKDIVNESIFETAKSMILNEMFTADASDIISKFPSLATFKDNIKKIKDISQDDKFGVIIIVAGIDKSEISSLRKNLHNDLVKNNMDNNYDVDVHVVMKDNKILAKIKIEAGEELGSNITENTMEMKKIDLLRQIHESIKKEEEAKQGCDECGEKMEQEVAQNEEVTEEEEETVCEKCGKKVCECGKMNESKKRTLRVTESKLIQIINKIVTEAIPGVVATEKAQKGSKRESDEYLSDVDKKMKDYANFTGNDNPEFPRPIGKGEKVAYTETDENQEYIDNNRGFNSLDLNYDGPETENDPPKAFEDRIQDALSGEQEMGNAQDDDTANAIKSDLGKDVLAKSKKRREARSEQPMYKKDVQPVNEEKAEEKPIVEEKKIDSVVTEEIKKMKRLSGYNEKTQ